MAIDKSEYRYAAPQTTTSGGFSQRDAVAIEAMKALLIGITRAELFTMAMEDNQRWESLAKNSFRIADAMCEASKP